MNCPVAPGNRLWSLVALCSVMLGLASAQANADEGAPVTAADFTADILPVTDSAEDEPVKSANDDAYREVEVVRERYPNRRVKIEREVTLDSEGNYVNHGTWKMWSEDGKLVAEGSYNMGKREGIWTRWHQRDDSASLRQHPFNRFESPFVSQATFVDGEIHGDWIIFDANQEKCSHVTMQHGKRSGPATVWLPGGKVYRKAVYQDNVPVGDVEQLNKDGLLEVVASYLDGRRLVTKMTHFEGTQNKKAEASYLGARMTVVSPDDFWNAKFAEYEAAGDQLRHGPWKTWYSNGQLKMEGYYRNDVELGTFTWWHPNGQKAVAGQYVDGQQHGEWSWWHPNGQKATLGEFHLGAQTGLWRQWSPDGKLDSQLTHDTASTPVSQIAEKSATDLPGDEPAAEMAQKPEFPSAPWMTR